MTVRTFDIGVLASYPALMRSRLTEFHRGIPLVLFLWISACGGREREESVLLKPVPEEKIDHDAVADAVEDARHALTYFTAELEAPRPGSTYAVKMQFEDNGEFELMWINDVSFDGAQFSGVLDSSPQVVTNVKRGDRGTVARDEVRDWLITDADGSLRGGYTIRAMLPSMDPEQRAAFTPLLRPLPD